MASSRMGTTPASTYNNLRIPRSGSDGFGSTKTTDLPSSLLSSSTQRRDNMHRDLRQHYLNGMGPFYMILSVILCLMSLFLWVFYKSCRDEDFPIEVRVARLKPNDRRWYFDYILGFREIRVEERKKKKKRKKKDPQSSSTDARESSSLNPPGQAQQSVPEQPPQQNTSYPVTEGCLICFEDYQVGDILVRSETCPHMYHKDCMVTYLTNYRLKCADREERTPLCPTCRQVFITLKPFPQDAAVVKPKNETEDTEDTSVQLEDV